MPESEKETCACCTQARVCGSPYPVFVGQAPDPGSHFNREDDEQEEEELEKQVNTYVSLVNNVTI